jgi:biopolymer transport protein ExbD
LSLQLPTASSAPPTEEVTGVEVLVGADGRYFFGTDEVVSSTPGALRAALLEAADADTDRQLIIRADARAEHQAVISLMDAAGRAGFSRISIVTAQVDDD